MRTATPLPRAYSPSSWSPRAICASIASRDTPATYLLPNTRTYGAPSACARSMKRRASSSWAACLAASMSCMLAELPRQETTSPCSASCRFASARRAGANSGTWVRSICVWSPRSSTAAKSCPAAKSSTWRQSHRGQPRVEKPSGMRPGTRSGPTHWEATTAAVVSRNSRRVVIGRLLPAATRAVGGWGSCGRPRPRWDRGRASSISPRSATREGPARRTAAPGDGPATGRST